MNSKIYYYLIVGLLVLLVIGGGIGFYYAAFGDLNFLKSDNVAIPNIYTPPTGLRVTQDGTLYFVWEKLPNGTTAINIYRARKGTQDWQLWKTVQIDGDLEKGLIQIQTSGVLDLEEYSFYYEAVNSEGETLWESEIDEIAPYIPQEESNEEQSTSSSQGTGGGETGGEGEEEEAPTSSTNNTSTQSESTSTPPTNGTTTPPGGGTTYPSGTIFYYTPNGDISGTKLYDSFFWVEVVNNRLQFGWQNLPPDTELLVLERGTNSNGPWTTILQQTNPNVSGPYTISLLDAAVYQSFSYRLRATAEGLDLLVLGPLTPAQ